MECAGDMELLSTDNACLIFNTDYQGLSLLVHPKEEGRVLIDLGAAFLV